ncbi:MAG: ribosome assembly RNA-binding protein YhbY [Magnetococcales bacterium]|nr:ribosome assembly RNA-binding protein YhbY [Magnetococcales bacterium]
MGIDAAVLSAPALSGFQRKFLRGQAHALQPVVWVGKDGLGETLLQEVDRALEDHELIKIKFNDHKERKADLSEEIARETRSTLAGMIGHVAIFYRPRAEVAKRVIVVPQRP